MKIIVKIDQASCFKRGVNAPHSTAAIEIDASKLDPKICKYIGSHLSDGVYLNLAFAMPSPTQKDVEAAVRACLQIEEARLASEAVFEEFLSPENLRLYREGRLSHVTRLQTNSKVIEPLLRELKTIQPATGSTLLKAVFTSPLPSPSLGLADIAVVTDLETMRGCIEPVPAVQPTWLDILNADWLPFVQKVEAKGVKVTAIQQQFDPPTDRIRINLLINVLGFQSNITVWMEGTMSTKVQLV